MTGLVIRDTFACLSGVEPQLVSGPLTFRRRCDQARAPGHVQGARMCSLGKYALKRRASRVSSV
jgi:hypothetical protein